MKRPPKLRPRVSKGPLFFEMRERLHVLGTKARLDPKSLTIDEIQELCDLVESLRPRERDEPPSTFE